MSPVAVSREAYGTLLLVLAAPSLLPGLGILAAPVAGLAGLAVGAQLVLGRRMPWVPARVRARMGEASLGPRLSRWLQARLGPLRSLRVPPLPRVPTGLAVLWSSLLLLLPLGFVPFGNMAPALSLGLLGAGLAAHRSPFAWLGAALSGGYTVLLVFLGDWLVPMVRSLLAALSGGGGLSPWTGA